MSLKFQLTRKSQRTLLTAGWPPIWHPLTSDRASVSILPTIAVGGVESQPYHVFLLRISHTVARLSPQWPPNSRTPHPQELRLSRHSYNPFRTCPRRRRSPPTSPVQSRPRCPACHAPGRLTLNSPAARPTPAEAPSRDWEDAREHLSTLATLS